MYLRLPFERTIVTLIALMLLGVIAVYDTPILTALFKESKATLNSIDNSLSGVADAIWSAAASDASLLISGAAIFVGLVGFEIGVIHFSAAILAGSLPLLANATMVGIDKIGYDGLLTSTVRLLSDMLPGSLQSSIESLDVEQLLQLLVVMFVLIVLGSLLSNLWRKIDDIRWRRKMRVRKIRTQGSLAF